MCAPHLSAPREKRNSLVRAIKNRFQVVANWVNRNIAMGPRELENTRKRKAEGMEPHYVSEPTRPQEWPEHLTRVVSVGIWSPTRPIETPEVV